MENKNTTITIKENTWSELNKRKKLGESMDDLIQRLCLEEPEVLTPQNIEEDFVNCIAKQNNAKNIQELKKRMNLK